MNIKIDPMEEKLFQEITETKAKEWDLFIANLKKSAQSPMSSWRRCGTRSKS